MPKPRPKKSLKVLFVGNSFTARNNLPGLIEQLASAHGLEFQHRLISVGGASLRTHWNKGEAQRWIKDGKFDYVVLQEQSTLPVKNAARMHENVRLFDELIKSSKARTALYLTWARQHAPQTQKAITDAYTLIGRELGATVVPVGVAWERFLSEHKLPVLHDKDKSHPTLAGSYLAACTFFATLFDVGAAAMKWNPEGLSDSQAKLIHDAAAAVGEG